jgi:EAL domain-containing protein (putative c-di-GMP-specific phosphodiesterase class I)
MDEEVLGRLELIADLRRARPGEQFVLHYQPSLDLATGEVVGVEALVRWNHPTRGLLQPEAFIWAAEETGLIVGLGRWVLAEACRAAARWRSQVHGASELGLSVNVSARQLQQPGLVDDVRRALAGSGLDPAVLTLEITESVLAERGDDAAAVLDAVKALGVRLALDDFGTGYSSLSRLQYLPVDELKIDRSFVQSIDSGADRAALVRAIVELGRALELTTVAEGIEHAGQVAALQRVGCRLGQGFHFARPLAAAELEELLVGWPRSLEGEAA